MSRDSVDLPPLGFPEECFCLAGGLGKFGGSGLGICLEGFPGTLAFQQIPHMVS